MKKLLFLFVLLSLIGLNGCKKSDSDISQTPDLVQKRDMFLKNVYDEPFTVLRTKSFYADEKNMFISEIQLPDVRMKAYTIQNKINGDMLYFVELDQNTGIMKIRDFVENDTHVVNWHEKINTYAKQISLQTTYDIFDLIDNGVPQTAGKIQPRFFGWSCDETYDPGGICFQACCYYILWVPVNCPSEVCPCDLPHC